MKTDMNWIIYNTYLTGVSGNFTQGKTDTVNIGRYYIISSLKVAALFKIRHFFLINICF